MTYLDELRSSVVCQEDNSTCPDGWTKLVTISQPATWANLLSSLAAMIGCVLMFAAYSCFRDYRTATRRVATSLALANFFLALGSFVGAVNFLVFSFLSPDVRSQDTACTAFGLTCQLQAFVTWMSTIASFVWTIILSGTLYVALVKGKISFLSRPVVWLLFFLSSVIVPFVIFVPMLGSNNLGYSPFYSGSGCFISTSYSYTLTSTALVSFVKGLEVIAYCAVILFFALISFDFREPTRFGRYGVRTDKRDYKLLTIPFFFVLFRLWGTLLAFLSIGLNYAGLVDEAGCVPVPAWAFLYLLSIMQAIGDPSQGWANAIPFIFFSTKIRQKMFRRLFFLDRLVKKKKPAARSPPHPGEMQDITSESESPSLEIADEKSSKLLSSSSPMEMKYVTPTSSDKSGEGSNSKDEESDAN